MLGRRWLEGVRRSRNRRPLPPHVLGGPRWRTRPSGLVGRRLAPNRGLWWRHPSRPQRADFAGGPRLPHPAPPPTWTVEKDRRASRTGADPPCCFGTAHVPCGVRVHRASPGCPRVPSPGWATRAKAGGSARRGGEGNTVRVVQGGGECEAWWGQVPHRAGAPPPPQHAAGWLAAPPPSCLGRYGDHGRLPSWQDDAGDGAAHVTARKRGHGRPLAPPVEGGLLELAGDTRPPRWCVRLCPYRAAAHRRIRPPRRVARRARGRPRRRAPHAVVGCARARGRAARGRRHGYGATAP